MTPTAIYENQNFYAPRFEIRLRGQDLSRAVIRDVLDVSYTDHLEKLDSFEFTLNDWDPVQRVPKYSSPYDESGNLRTLEDGSPVPNFDPGAKIELRMGYYGPEEPAEMLTGTIVSITPNFPSGGPPTLRLRALNPLFKWQKKQETKPFENKKDSEIAEEIGTLLGIQVEIPDGQKQDEESHEYVIMENQYPIVFLMGRARRLGYDIYIESPEEGGDPVLFFGKTETTRPTYELSWGKTLVEFSPAVKTKGQVTRVAVLGWDPRQRGEDRRIEGVALLDDVDLDLPDPKLAEAIDSALEEHEEQVVDDPSLTQAEAERKAQGILRTRLQSLITGRGSTVGLPGLRAGRTVILNGLGVRYSGRYVITETTHQIGGNGYTTRFGARLEGKA